MLKISIQIYQIRQADINWNSFFSALMYQASLITIYISVTKYLLTLFFFLLIFFRKISLISSFPSCISWNHIPYIFHLWKIPAFLKRFKLSYYLDNFPPWKLVLYWNKNYFFLHITSHIQKKIFCSTLDQKILICCLIN